MGRDVWPESTTRTIRRRLRNKEPPDRHSIHKDSFLMFVGGTRDDGISGKE